MTELYDLLAASFGGLGSHAVAAGAAVVLYIAQQYVRARYLSPSKTPVIDALGQAVTDYLRSIHEQQTATPAAPPPTTTDAKVTSELGLLAPILMQLLQAGGAKPAEPATAPATPK